MYVQSTPCSARNIKISIMLVHLTNSLPIISYDKPYQRLQLIHSWLREMTKLSQTKRYTFSRRLDSQLGIMAKSYVPTVLIQTDNLMTLCMAYLFEYHSTVSELRSATPCSTLFLCEPPMIPAPSNIGKFEIDITPHLEARIHAHVFLSEPVSKSRMRLSRNLFTH
jgi:hypothetical protein